MNLAKKALSLGTSAALVASLLATVAAPAAFASTTVVSAGSIAAGSTSTGTASFTFTENTITSFTGPGTLTVTILDANSQNTLTFSGGVLAAPGSLGATLAVSGNTFTVTTTGNDNNNIEQITVSGLKIAATTAAATGGIIATLTGTGGTPPSAVVTQTTSATGYLFTSVNTGSTSAVIAVTSSCPFVVTGTGAGPAGDLVINGVDVGAASVMTNVVTPPTYQTATVPALGTGYAAGVAVSQANVPNCSGNVLASPGTIGAIVTQNATSKVVFPGQNNQLAGTTTAVEPSAGFLAANSTLTFTLPTGVLFSQAPVAGVTASGGIVAVPTGLSATQATGAQPPANHPGTVLNGTYYFEVAARGLTSGSTLPSAPVAVTVASAVTGTGAINLSWTAVSGFTAGYDIYMSTTLAGTYNLLTVGATLPILGTTASIIVPPVAGGAAAPTANNAVPANAAVPGGLAGTPLNGSDAGPVGTWGVSTAYFEVTAKGSTGETTASAPLAVTIAAAATTLTLNWAAVPGAVSYNVYESSNGVQPYVLVASAVATNSKVFATPPTLSSTTVPPTTNTAVGNAAGLTLTAGTCALSFDRTSCTVTVNTASTVASAITLSGILLDLASTVPNGTSVTATLTGSPAFTVYVNSNVIAVVNRTLVGVGATPTVWIGYNAQQSGVLTITESAAGFLQAGLNNNNAFQVCVADFNPTNSNASETFTFAPWAVVTTGNVSLLNTSTNVGVSSVAGTLNATNTCATWTVYAASTTASTITIVGANAAGALPASVPTNGPTLNIDPNATPGAVTFAVGTGTLTGSTFNALYSTNAVNAIRAFKSGVVVTAVTQPYIAAGTIGPAGNIQVAETLNGQLVAGETFTCELLQPNAENNAFWISSQNSNDLPIVSTNLASGLVAHLVSFPTGAAASTFSVYIDQQAVAPNTGTVTISNLKYQTATGAPLGPINVECFNSTVVVVGTQVNRTPSIGAAFDQFISNAINGSAPTLAPLNIAAVSALGLRPTSGYSTKSLKIQAKGKYVTWKFSGGAALAGQTVKIWVTTAAVPGVWGPWKAVTARVSDANGIATYWFKSTKATSISVRAEWMGNATYGDSLSPARGVTWK